MQSTKSLIDMLQHTRFGSDVGGDMYLLLRKKPEALKQFVKGLTVIDLGCGYFGLANEFIEQGAKGYIGVDLFNKSTEKISDEVQYVGSDILEFLEKQEAGEFVVTANSVFDEPIGPLCQAHHSDDLVEASKEYLRRTFNEIKRITKKHCFGFAMPEDSLEIALEAGFKGGCYKTHNNSRHRTPVTKLGFNEDDFSKCNTWCNQFYVLEK